MAYSTLPPADSATSISSTNSTDSTAADSSPPNSEEGAERALQLFKDGSVALGDYADPGRSKRRAGYWYVTDIKNGGEVRKVRGTVKNYGQIHKTGEFAQRSEAAAEQVKKIQDAREARGGYGKVEHETPTAERQRREAASASLPYIHGLTAQLLRCPSMRCANCVPTTVDGLLLATG